MHNMPKCTAYKQDGKRCSKDAIGDHGYCSVHNKRKRAKITDNDTPHNEVVNEEKKEEAKLNMEQNALVLSLIETMNNLRISVLSLEENLQRSKTQNKKRHKRRAKSAKMLYYHEQKENPEVVRIARDELCKSEGFAKVYDNRPIPWQLVKHVTDSMFDQMSQAMKNEYYSKVLEGDDDSRFVE